MEYKHLEIEPKWQKYWEENKTFKTDTRDFTKPKYYRVKRLFRLSPRHKRGQIV